MGNSLNCSIDNYYISPDFEFFKKKKNIFLISKSHVHILLANKNGNPNCCTRSMYGKILSKYSKDILKKLRDLVINGQPIKFIAINLLFI